VIQLEADTQTGNDTFDESYLRLDTDLGQFRLGSSDAAGLALQVEAPYVGINATNGDQALWIVNPSTNVAGIGGTTIGGGDDNRVYYITPSFGGLRLGTSYAASTTENIGTQPLVSESDIWDVSARWEGKVGDFALSVGGGYWWTEGSTAINSGSARNFQFGSNITFADFTFGGGYGEKNQKMGSISGGDTTSWNLGLVYKPGPWSAGLSYYNGNGEATSGIEGNDKASRWVLGATYAIGPGVTAMTNVLHHTYNDEANAITGENKGVAVIGGIQLAF
jgi:predicted porin